MQSQPKSVALDIHDHDPNEPAMTTTLWTARIHVHIKRKNYLECANGIGGLSCDFSQIFNTAENTKVKQQCNFFIHFWWIHVLI